jgi:hypothetical protein
VADHVHAAVDRVKVARSDSAANGAVGDPDAPQLSEGDHPVLPGSQLGDEDPDGRV